HALRAAACPCSIAAVARRQALKLDYFFATSRGFFEFHLEVIAQIIAGTVARTRASTSGAEEIAENIRENFLEALAEIKAAAPTCALRSLECGMAEPVVLAALLRIRQDLIGLVQFLEF